MKSTLSKSGILLAFIVLSGVLLSNKRKIVNVFAENPKIDRLKLQDGFKAEHLLSPSEKGLGSWVSMTFDDKGRMIVSDQYGGLYRLKIPAIGSGNNQIQIEKLSIGKDSLVMGAAHGLLYAFNSLYVMVNNRPSKQLPKTSGFYRIQDTDGDDKFDKVTLLKELKGDGEHGPHSVILAPDKKSLYVISGNHTDVPSMDAHRLPNNWQEDNLFPLIKDPRGHANDRMAPGGWIAQVDSSGKRWELISAGYRNAFDMAFNDVGDLFVYDADMEWDFGMPWYRPTRICHATSASEFGWRTGNSKWSPTYPDNLPPVLNIGQGSPTNLLYLKDAKFPAKYKQSLLAFDWSFGIIHAIHLKPAGATYTAEREEFLSGMPLPLTDGLIGPDGALYFLTGGRRLESDLYRIYYAGNEPTNTIAAQTPLTKENILRRNLEKYHSNNHPEAINVAWQHLKHPDRFVRYAARLAIEHQPIETWKAKALTEKDPIIALNAVLALIRQGNEGLKNDILNKLLSIDFKTLTENEKIDLLRAYELTFLRMSKPDLTQKNAIFAQIEAAFPTKSIELNRELSKVLVYLESKKTLIKIIDLLGEQEIPNEEVAGGKTATASADLILRNPQYGLDIAKMLEKTPPAQQIYYATVLSQAKENWTPELSEKYFLWFKKAFDYRGGLSYIGFIDKARKMALKNVPVNKQAYYDKLSGGTLLTKSGNDIAEYVTPKGPWRNWKLDDAMQLFDQDLKERSFEQGKAMYQAVTCSRCHSIQGEGGNIGPDLTQLGTRFSRKDILEAIIDPNKVISDQYAATQFQLKNGRSLVGRLVNEDKEFYYISQNPYSPEVLEKISKKMVISKKYASVSTMLPGLINPLGEEELKDLMAFLLAGGNKNHPIFTKQSTK